MKNRLEFIFEDIGLDFRHGTKKESQTYIAHMEKIWTHYPTKGENVWIFRKKLSSCNYSALSYAQLLSSISIQIRPKVLF